MAPVTFAPAGATTPSAEFLYKEADKKYTGCNLKTMELLDCALRCVCAVIRSNTVYSYGTNGALWIQQSVTFMQRLWN